MKQPRVLIHRDDKELATLKRSIESNLSTVQAFVNEAKEIGLEITDANFSEAVLSTTNFAEKHFAKKAGPAPMMGGYELQVKLKLPDISALTNLAEKIKLSNKAGLSFFSISEDGTVSLNPESIETLVEERSLYLEGKEKVELFENYKAMTDAINQFSRFIKTRCGSKDGITLINIREYIDNDGNGEIKPHLYLLGDLAKSVK